MVHPDNTKLLPAWLHRNGSNVQHLRLQFYANPISLLSVLPTSTPQLKSLRAFGLSILNQPMPINVAATWKALSRLTSLEVDTVTYLARGVKQLPNLVELSLTSFTGYSSSSIMHTISNLQQLQVLCLPAMDCYQGYTFTKQELDVFGSLQQLQQVDNICINSADLTHPFVLSKCYPTIQTMIRGSTREIDITEWVQKGGDRRVMKLVLASKSLEGLGRPSIVHWAGLSSLRSLELIRLDLSPELQQLRELTQLTHLKMDNCSPPLHSIHQLPPGLCSLSLDNLWCHAAIHEQQQQQEVSRTSTAPQLPHLTSLVLKGDRTAYSAGKIITALLNLQRLVLDSRLLAPDFRLEPLSQLTSLSSLTVPHLGLGNRVLEGLSVMEKLPDLQQLRVTRQRISPVQGLEVAARLGHLTEIKLDVESARHRCGHVVSGGPLQVRVLGLVGKRWKEPVLSLIGDAKFKSVTPLAWWAWCLRWQAHTLDRNEPLSVC
jgi:hypothetical protein